MVIYSKHYQCCSSLKNVNQEYCFSQDMNLCWLVNVMVIYVLSSLFYPCKGYEESKHYLGKNYCEHKRLQQGKKEIEYNSFLWSIERDGSPPSYLFGTIHAPYHLVWRYIPQNSQAALVDATHVYTEVDLRDQKVISAIRKCRQLPGNLTIRDVLPKKLFKEFKRVLYKFKASRRKWRKKILRSVYALQLLEESEYDIYNDFSKLKPMWLISTILQQWNRFFVKQQLKGRMISLDGELVNLAADAYRGGIEKVSSHCEPMDKLEIEKVHLALNVTLQALDKKLSGKFHMKENDIRRVINLYKCGDPMDTNRLETLFRDLVETDVEKKLAQIDEYLSRELMLKRNMLMANTIETMLKNKEYDDARMFFAVGAAHLLGNQSMVTHLREKGYTVRHIQPGEEIPATVKIRKVLENTPIPYPSNNSSMWWKREKPNQQTNGKDKHDQNIFIITKIEKNYVYYYSRSTLTSVPTQASLLSTVFVLIVVWVLSTG